MVTLLNMTCVVKWRQHVIHSVKECNKDCYCHDDTIYNARIIQKMILDYALANVIKINQYFPYLLTEVYKPGKTGNILKFQQTQETKCNIKVRNVVVQSKYQL